MAIPHNVAEFPMDLQTYVRLAESSPAILAAFNDTQLKWVNASWTRHLGWSLDEARNHTLRSLQHPEDLPLFDGATGTPSATAATVRTRMRLRDGSYRLIDWFVGPLSQGLFYGRDVEKQMHAERTLERRLHLLQKAEELAGVGSWSVDVKTGVQTWSPQVFRIYGITPSDTAPSLEAALSAYHPDDRARVSQLVADAAMRGAPFEFDLRLIRTDGQTRSVFSSGHCVTNPDTGETETIFGTFLDVTERDRARDERAHEQRLMTMGMLAAGIGHEMNNPLTFVAANVDGAIEEIESIFGASPSKRLRNLLELLADAKVGAERLRRVVRGLRAMSQTEDPTIPTSVREVIDMSVALSLHEVHDRALCDVQVDDVAMVVATEARLSQVLVNLICNAAQAFPPPYDTRNRIKVRANQSSADWTTISVSDNGVGMSEEVTKRVFEPFYTTKASGGGMGLGLAISQSIVESFGGKLECTSLLGAGTTFTITLPVYTGGATMALSPASGGAVPPELPAPPAPGTLGHVVIVDDEAVLLRALERLLCSNHVVRGFVDSREALEYLRTVHNVDVILCDLMMPHLDGEDLYKTLAVTRPELSDRFVFMSGGATTDKLREFLLELPGEVLAKPFDTLRLRAHVRELVMERTPPNQ
jgi:signal transduction histidine kinase